MKTMALILLACLLAMAGIAYARGDGSFMEGVRGSGVMLTRFLPVLVVAVAISGFAQVLIPEAFVKDWLSDASGFRGLAIAWLAGVLTPAGSLVGLPLVAALWEAGVGIGVLVTYMTSLALLSLLRLPIEVSIIGWRLALLRVGVSLLLPFIAGIAAKAIAPWVLP